MLIHYFHQPPLLGNSDTGRQCNCRNKESKFHTSVCIFLERELLGSVSLVNQCTLNRNFTHLSVLKREITDTNFYGD